MTQEVERARAANAELERSAREIEDDLNAGRGARHAELTNLQIECVGFPVFVHAREHSFYRSINEKVRKREGQSVQVQRRTS
jgi:hypothetical protein